MMEGSKRMGRRGLLGFAALALGASALPMQRAAAQSVDAGGPTAPVRRLNDALLAVMRQGRQVPFAQRFNALAPVVEQSFDLTKVLADSVGLRWSTVPDDQKSRLLAAFRRYTISSYAANFDSYAGQRFEIAPDPRQIGGGQVVVETRIVPEHGSPTRLSYVMRQEGGTWKAVDVLADGSISRVAVQRSDFRHLLSTGGVQALVDGLQTKVANLSGGMAA
jgi:phospholipid transport system substrate-binding protein